ncbi:MAG: cupin domain-containing protein [Acidimicrobiia bacterium]
MRQTIAELPIEVEQGELSTRYAEWGEMAVRYARLPAGTDMSPVLEGLPDDRCPSPHWGIVLEGSVHLRHADGTEETTRAGELYHWPAGHTAWTDEATVFLEVGPAGPMRQFSEHAKQQMAG